MTRQANSARSMSVADIQAIVDADGSHAPTWAFSGCSCGWTVSDVREGRRMPQYIAHVVEVVTSATPYVDEGWWHPNVKSGQVHDHTAVQPQTMHRLCVPVYTRRKSS